MKPYTGENPELLKTFSTTLYPEAAYTLGMSMSETGLTTFSLLDSKKFLLETQAVQHQNLCVDNFYEGIVDGLYFGGTCEAPVDVIVTYQ
jgi:hypothetical protein